MAGTSPAMTLWRRYANPADPSNLSCRLSPTGACFPSTTRPPNRTGGREDPMTDQSLDRRDFLKGAVVGGAAAATTGAALPQEALAQQPAAPAAATAPPASAGYVFLNLEE